MTVEDLIEKLNALPPEMPALIQVYGNAYNDIGDLITQKVVGLNHPEESGDLLRQTHSDPRFSDVDSRDSAIEHEAENGNSDLREKFTAAVIRGKPRN